VRDDSSGVGEQVAERRKKAEVSRMIGLSHILTVRFEGYECFLQKFEPFPDIF
jgi:hypothetical protein